MMLILLFYGHTKTNDGGVFMKKKLILIGSITGIVNGLLGGGAGMLCVPLLRKTLQDDKGAHAYTVATILAASLVSTVIYWFYGHIQLSNSWQYILGGMIAAPVGVFLLKKAKPSFIRKSFAVFMMYCGLRICIYG